MENQQNIFSRAVSDFLSLMFSVACWLAVFYILGLWMYGWVCLFGRREVRLIVGNKFVMTTIGVVGFLAIIAVTMVCAYFTPTLPVPNDLTAFLIVVMPWSLFGIRVLIESLTNLRQKPAPTVDPSEKPLFKENVFVTTKTNRRSVATTFFLCTIPLMAAGAMLGDDLYFVICYKLVLSMAAYLSIRWVLAHTMRRSSAGIHTHAAWILAILLWPIYATAFYKIGVPGALFDMGQNLTRNLIFSS